MLLLNLFDHPGRISHYDRIGWNISRDDRPCAARSDDRDLRQKMVDGWRKYWGHTRYTADNVHCDGCLAENGRQIDGKCEVRPCCREKGIPNCAHCDEIPCDKLKKLLNGPEHNFARFGDIPEEDYNLCIRQFDSIPRLMKLRAELKAMKREHASEA